MTLSSLKLDQSVLPSPTFTLSTQFFNQPHLIAISGKTIHVLDESGKNLISSISFDQAFPSSRDQSLEKSIRCIAVDQESNRIVASLGNRLAVFEPLSIELKKWRVHSSFSLNLHQAERGTGEIEALDYVKGLIVVAMNGMVRVWKLQEKFGLPQWNQFASLPFDFNISQLKLHTLSNLLAILPKGACSCIIYDLLPSNITPTPTSSSTSTSKEVVQQEDEFSLIYRSRTIHSSQISSISWRLPFATTISDSGPILITSTTANNSTNHYWGCVIDEPDKFSLWSTLPNPLPSSPVTIKKGSSQVEALKVATNTRLPLSPLDPNRFEKGKEKEKEKQGGKVLGKRDRTLWCGYWRTREKKVSDKEKGKGKGGGREDLWISLKEDGKFWLTIVSNLDSRPPTCLTQITIPLSTSTNSSSSPSTHVQQQDLSYFRHTSLLPSRSQPEKVIHLVARSSWNGLKHYELQIPSSCSSSLEAPSPSSPLNSTAITNDTFKLKSSDPSAISFVGRIRKFVRPFPTGESLLILGTPCNSSSSRSRDGRIQTFSSSNEEEGVPMSSSEGTVMDLDGFGEDEEGRKKRLAQWKGGRMVVVGEGGRLSVYERDLDERGEGMKLRVRREMRGVKFEDAKVFMVVRRTEDDVNTWVVAVTKRREEGEGGEEGRRKCEYEIHSWIYHERSNEIFDGALTKQITAQDEGETVVWVSIVPPSKRAREGDSLDEIELQSIDSRGTVRNWRLSLRDEVFEWRVKGEGIRTAREGVRRCSSRGNGVIAIATDEELSIWNDKNLKFGNSLVFTHPLTEAPVSLEFSIDTNLLAFASRTQVLIFATQRRSHSEPLWSLIAVINPSTPSPITNLQFHLSGLAIACEFQLFFHSFELVKHRKNKRGVPVLLTKRVREELDETGGALGVVRSEVLEMAIRFGHFETVRKVFIELAKEIDEDGKALVRVNRTDRGSLLKVDGFLDEMRKDDSSTKGDEKKIEGDVLSALSSSEGKRQTRSTLIAESEGKLSESSRDRLVKGLTRGDLLRKVSKDEHERLGVLVQAIYETQSKQSSVDSNGLLYLVALRSLVNARPKALSLSAPSSPTVDSPRLSSRDILFAYYSNSQQVLLDESIEAVGASGKLSWENARSLGIPLWLRDQSSLIRTMELIGRTSFLLDPENREPILPMLFYLSLRKLPQVYTFWKQSIGHSDQRQMLKFLSNDFDTERWRSAARKNAFALLSKRRFLFAAAFFLLGDSLSDCISVILRHLEDPLLAIAIARTYEGGDDRGPFMKELIEKTILKDSLEKSDRFTSCWSFEMLGKKELAIKVMVNSLPSLTAELGDYGFDSISDPIVEDPVRIVFVKHLLESSKRKEMVKNESEFVLCIARQLCESGCQLVALELLRSYQFPRPPQRQAKMLSKPTSPYIAIVAPTQFVEPDMSSLFDMSTPKPRSKPLPPTVMAIAEDTKEKEEEEEAKEREKRLFREATGAKPKIETKATVDAFSFDAFGF